VKIRQYRVQSGFALLIFVVVLMGIGGVALTGFAQKSIKEIQSERFKRNKQILESAKHALLMYAYRYPDFNAQGPGRLPCPYDEESGYSGSVSAAICNKVGRLPRLNADLNFENEAKDATGEYLWYAVSGEFRNVAANDFGVSTNGDDVVNSDSLGTISIFDQTGSLIYDGAVNGVAAVIIAPGTPLAGQDRNADPLDPANYLDSFDGFDNSLFENGSSDAEDGFILGPVKDNATNSVVINDQFIVITADEVVAMIEKATLEAYRDAINEYLVNTNTGVNNHPWLFDHNVTSLDNFSGLATSAATADTSIGSLSNIGRIPSIFSRYFDDVDSQPIESQLRLSLTKQFRVAGDATVHSLSLAHETTILSNVRFSPGQLNADASAESYSDTLYFWSPPPLVLSDPNWSICPDGGDELSDCNQDSGGAATPGSTNNLNEIRVLIVTIGVDYNSGVSVGLDYSTSPPTISYLPATAAPDKHARIQAVFSASDVTGIATMSVERGLYSTSSVFSPSFDEDRDATNDSDIVFFGPADVFDQSTGNIEFELNYYPELPYWAHSSEDNWHNSILMAISPDHQPGGLNDCVNNPLPCLTVGDLAGANNDKISLVVIAGNISEFSDEGLDGFSDDLSDIFEVENANADSLFLSRGGDDTIMIIQ